MFYKKARNFMRKILRIRLKLIQSGSSKMNPSTAQRYINDISRYLDFYGYRRNADMAMFWRRYRQKVYDLIPKGSPSSATLIDQYQQIDQEAIQIVTTLDKPKILTL